MVVNFGHVVFAQVRQLVANINKKNFKATSAELNQVGESRAPARCSSGRCSPGDAQRMAGGPCCCCRRTGVRRGMPRLPASLRLRCLARCCSVGGGARRARTRRQRRAHSRCNAGAMPWHH